MHHDRARPGAQVLQVALERLLRQEVHRANRRHGVTVLMDLSTFYDTIKLQQLQDQAIAINYPPLMLEMAMQLYTGPKAIIAEQEMTPFFHVDQGVPAGCPQAPLLAKAVLTPALAPWHEQHPHIHLSSWVDDIGYDTAGSTPQKVAQQAIEAYRDLHQRLTQLGMKVSAKKTAFIGTDKQVNRALKDILTEDEPPVVPVMRDLGIDHQAGRARRIPVMKQRMQKAQQRKLKLRNLKVPALRVRLRLHRGGIQPVAVWGVESQGLAPRYRQALRHALAKQLGHHTGGNLDVTYDIHKSKYMDPADQIIIHHIRAMHQLIQAWPEEQLPQLRQAWTATLESLQAKQHPWYTVKGPMAATIAYMLEWGWNVQDLLHWTRPATDIMLAAELHITDQWWQLEHHLTTEAHQQRTHRFANRPQHQHLLTGLDWHTYRILKPKLPEQQARHLQTWVQGAIHYRDAKGPKPCPICHVPATAKHVLWLCKWHKTQKHKPLPADWLDRITNPEEEALWSKGWIPLEPQEHLHQQHPYQGHGVWKELQPIGPDQYAGFAFTLDATPSHYDTRSQIWVFGLCLHTQTMGQLKRLGAITGAASGHQSKGRALFAGLVALAKHTTTPAKVIVQLSTVWEAWQKPPHKHPYPDLLAEVTPQDRQRITVLYISKNTRTPDAPGNEPQLRRRQRDAALTAWERADALHDRRQTSWQTTLDRDHKAIYLQAAQRLEKIFQDKQHYLHTKADRQPGKQTKQRKKELIHQCTKPWQENHHRWAPQRSGYACTTCGTRMHQGLTTQQLEDRLGEPCNQQLAEQACPEPGPEASGPTKKLTRAQVIRNLLNDQTNKDPAPHEHHFEETTGYLKCTKCGTSVHKRVNEQAFKDYLSGPCLDCPFEGEHKGHPSHKLWQKGQKISCTGCGLQLHLDSNRRIITSTTFLKECRGAGTQGSPPIHAFFKATPPTPATAEPQGLKHTQATTLSNTGPRPKRLHFTTPLTKREDEHDPEQAMIPSRATGSRLSGIIDAQQPTAGQPRTSPEIAEEESLEDDEDVMPVDFF